MIEDVDNLQAAEKLDTVTPEFEVKRVLDFRIEADVGWETAGLVALADIVPVLIKPRVRESRVHIEDGNKLQFPRKAENTPEKYPVGRVARKRAELIGANKRIRVIAKELVVVVQLPASLRINIAGDDAGGFSGVPTEHNEKLVIGLMT